jgi:exosortase A
MIKKNYFTIHLVKHIFWGMCILGLFIITYYDILSWMYIRYSGADSYYSHGFLIPFVSGVLIWFKKEELKNQEIAMSWWGLVLIIGALLMHVLGTILYIFSISGFSIFLLAVGLILFLFGKDILRIILFPVIFLIFMIPLPVAFLTLISIPLKTIVAEAGTTITRLLGIPVLREGFNIAIPAGNLEIGNPCSGLRSLIALLALGAVFAYVTNLSIWKKWILFFLAIPSAIFSNIIRVLLLILIAHFWGISVTLPDTILHNMTGLVVFLGAILIMFIFKKLLGWEF